MLINSNLSDLNDQYQSKIEIDSISLGDRLTVLAMDECPLK